jgi:hypothetical protein
MPGLNDKRLARPEGTATAWQVIVPAAPLRERPNEAARLDTQLLCGEVADVFREQDGFALVRARRDHYTGWVPRAALTPDVTPPTHKVSALLTLGFREPDLKSPNPVLLPLGALLTATGRREGAWMDCGRNGWVSERHLAGLDVFSTDPAGIAERFLEAPYLWGGRGEPGLDCSGLTQQAFEACGVILPRDSDMQAAWAGDEVERWQAPGALKRGDLIFWEGHVGIMTRPDELIHANAWHMAVAREPLAAAISRIRKVAGEVTCVRRVNIARARNARPVWLRED